jgi:NADH dehydrogenase
MERLVTVIGGTGFVGRALAEELARRGYRLRIVSRNPAAGNLLKPLGDLGQIASGHADVRDPATLAAAVRGAELVVNLVGAMGGREPDLAAVNHYGAANVARAAAAAGAKGLVHVSALGVAPGDATAYGRTKAAGETAVRAAFPAAAIVRPSILFGAEDRFTNRLARLVAMAPVVPVLAPEARLQPAFVCDVAAGLARIAERQYAGGGAETFELAGPEVRTMREIVHFIAAAAGRARIFIEPPAAAGRLLAALRAGIGPEELALLERGVVASGMEPGFFDLGLQPAPLESVGDIWLARYRPGGRFAAAA